MDFPILPHKIKALDLVISKVQNDMVSLEVEAEKGEQMMTSRSRQMQNEWQTFLLLSMVLNRQMQQREKVVIVQQHLVC